MKTLPVLALVAAFGMSFAPQEPAGKPTAPVAPAARQEAFMAALKAGDVAKAYEGLTKGSRLEGKDEQLANLREQTEKAVKIYGGVVAWENAGIARQEKHQALGIAILCCDHVPVYFYFIWYRNAETAPWTLVNVWFSDQAKDYFILRR